jgi:formate dehydrogenase major subunit
MTGLPREPRAAALVPVTLTINGHTVHAYAGQTILQAATEAGINIPTLCHHPAVSAHGGCRMCVVEIEKQRALQPSCTFPVSNGLVVQTSSPRVVEARKFVLEMLFSERQHYCMFCPVSGGEHSSDCELQRLAYAHGLNCWEYVPNYSVRWPVDATRQHFVLDQSRCILCRRCVRACNELAASHTLGVQHRGAKALICADDGVPFGESTCVSCGTCLQICPTGALIDRRSAFIGHDCDTQRTRTTCVACAVGCSIETVTHQGRVIRVEGVWDAPNGGVLCERGRFDVLDDLPPRLDSPIVRRDGKAVEVSWDEALTFAAKGLKTAKSVAGLITPRSTNQCLVAFNSLFHDVLRSDQVALLSGRLPPLGIGAPATMQELLASDCIVVIGGNPMANQKVLGYLIRRAVDHGAKLIVAAAEETDLDIFADLLVRLQGDAATSAPGAAQHFQKIYHLRPDPLAQVKKQIETAQKPVLLYGADLGDELYGTMRTLPAKTRFIPLVEGANAVWAARIGLSVRPVSGEALYVVASDENPNGTQLPPAQFRIVQASYRNEWTDQADVALPSKIWFEKTGHTTNLTGARLPLTRSIDAPHDILNDWQTLFMLSVKLGQPLGCITVNEGM